MCLIGGVNCYAASVDGLTIKADGTTLTITGTGDLTSKATEVANEIRTTLTAADANYSTVIFKSTGDEKCKINNDIVWAILYTDANLTASKTLETVNLGDVVVENLSYTTFCGTNGTAFVVPSYSGAAGFEHKLDVTIPLTKEEDGEMTVPSYLFKSKDQGYLSEPVQTLHIPSGYTKLANNAFSSSKNITNVEFPTTVKYIGDQAFASCLAYVNVQLTEGLEFIGNCAFYRESSTDQETLEVPSTVKYMGPGSFANRRYKDVYYHGTTAPISPLGKISMQEYAAPMAAFDAAMLYGNSGFTANKKGTSGVPNNGTANRENYYNGSTYFAVLHFRSDLTDEQAATFTDITRKYQYWTNDNGEWAGYGTKKTFGKESSQIIFHAGQNSQEQNYSLNEITPGFADTDLGTQLIWPSQNQWIRSYVNNSCGLCFDGVTEYKPELSDEQIKILRDNGFGDKDVEYYDPLTGNKMTGYTEEALRKLAYLGTRQFVLVSRDVQGKKDEYDPSIKTGQRWWTVCVPCDVTKAEVDRVFGKGTHLCLFSKVKRTVNNDNTPNVLHLYFQNDTYKNKYTRAQDGTWTKGETIADDDSSAVVLYAHTPYMVYPMNRDDDGHEFILKNFTIKSGDVLRTVVKVEGATDDDAISYIYTGNYRSKVTTEEKDNDGNYKTESVALPQYSYVFGRTNQNDATGASSKFFFYTGTKGSWSANKCLVEREDATGGAQDLATFFNGNSNTSNAKQISTFGDMDYDGTTAVERVVYHYGEDSDAPVYNINGQLVSRDGDTTGLVKGVYIKAGKKFVVK